MKVEDLRTYHCCREEQALIVSVDCLVRPGLASQYGSDQNYRSALHCTVQCAQYGWELCWCFSLGGSHVEICMVESREGSRGKKKLQIYIHVTQIKSDPEVMRLIAHINTRLVK